MTLRTCNYFKQSTAGEQFNTEIILETIDANEHVLYAMVKIDVPNVTTYYPNSSCYVYKSGTTLRAYMTTSHTYLTKFFITVTLIKLG